MNRMERLQLVDKAARELQKRWTYADISEYLSAWGVDCEKPTSDGGQSKWVYSKDLLSSESDETVLGIADELGIKHNFSVGRATSTTESKFWTAGFFRLFISHISADKVKASQLQRHLRDFGISGFVAHEDIEPTTEWQEEIEKALFSMDALAALLTPGYKDSDWTDQEVGIAVGRDVMVLPIRVGVDPYGFIAKYQGLQARGKKAAQISKEVFIALSANKQTRIQLADALVSLLISSSNATDASHWLEKLEKFKGIPLEKLEKLQTNALGNEMIVSNERILGLVNDLLRNSGLSAVSEAALSTQELDDDIPF